jgi:hypothetical protein
MGVMIYDGGSPTSAKLWSGGTAAPATQAPTTIFYGGGGAGGAYMMNPGTGGGGGGTTMDYTRFKQLWGEQFDEDGQPRKAEVKRKPKAPDVFPEHDASLVSWEDGIGRVELSLLMRANEFRQVWDLDEDGRRCFDLRNDENGASKPFTEVALERDEFGVPSAVVMEAVGDSAIRLRVLLQA